MMTGATMPHENVQPRSRVWWWPAGLVLAPVFCQQIDAVANLGDNTSVLFNSGTGFSSLNHTKADTAAQAAFLCPSNAIRAPSMVGRGGEPSGCRFLGAGLLTLPCACPPPFSSGARVSIYQGGLYA